MMAPPRTDPPAAASGSEAPHCPLVSIVVPVLNGERYLAESLDSILAQTYKPMEVLVIDDASTDGTREIIDSYGGQVRHHSQPSALGIYANENTGIRLARGELIATYHADDIYNPEIVERQVDFLECHPEVAAVFCKDIFIGPTGRRLGKLELPADVPVNLPIRYEALVTALLKYKNVFLRCPSAMVRASVYRELGGYNQDEFKNTSDMEMWLRIARRYPLGIIDEHLFFYRRGHGSSSERYHKLRLEPERFFTILDLELKRVGRDIVPPAVLGSYEAHRAEDSLRVAAANYIAGRSDQMQRLLAGIRLRQILGGRNLPRQRLLVLWGILNLLAPLPRLKPAAHWLHRRLYLKSMPETR